MLTVQSCIQSKICTDVTLIGECPCRRSVNYSHVHRTKDDGGTRRSCEYCSSLDFGITLLRAACTLPPNAKKRLVQIICPRLSWSAKAETIRVSKEHTANVFETKMIQVLDVTSDCNYYSDCISAESKSLEIQAESNTVRTLRIPPAVETRQFGCIDELKGEEFMSAWADCYRRHFHLWSIGIRRSDISLRNLMYDRATKRGILSDLDLNVARSPGSLTPCGKNRTVTVPFMALDLLTQDYYSEKITHLYRHDVESFIWVLPYVLLRDTNPAVVDSWNTGRFYLCEFGKEMFLRNLHWYQEARPPNDRPWTVGYALVKWLCDKRRSSTNARLVDNSDSVYDLWNDPSMDAARKIFHEVEDLL